MCIYRYGFNDSIPVEDIEAALLLAIWGCEALHGEAQTRLDAAHYLDIESKACVIDAQTAVGKDFAKLFDRFMRRECGEGAMHVEEFNVVVAHS